MESQLGSAGIDLGEAENPMSEELPGEKGLELDVSEQVITKDKKEANESESGSGVGDEKENTKEEEKEMPQGDQSETEET